MPRASWRFSTTVERRESFSLAKRANEVPFLTLMITGRPLVLGERTGPGRSRRGRPGPSGGLGSGRLHGVPRRALGCPAQLGRAGYPGLAYFNEVDKGGHFAAWEEPELFYAELREGFSSLR